MRETLVWREPPSNLWGWSRQWRNLSHQMIWNGPDNNNLALETHQTMLQMFYRIHIHNILTAESDLCSWKNFNPTAVKVCPADPRMEKSGLDSIKLVTYSRCFPPSDVGKWRCSAADGHHLHVVKVLVLAAHVWACADKPSLCMCSDVEFTRVASTCLDSCKNSFK